MNKKIRLSQCMIVKNEEKNIKKALTWAKNIAFEQIVVDTGSTDHTVEIAKEMGAKVYHFTWCDDFAAAKNYAIEQAKGDWIAFLDADEYMQEEDAKWMLSYLQKIESQKKYKIDFVRCALVNLNDQSKVFATSKQDRFFRNDQSIRYVGNIHEQIKKMGQEKLKYVLAPEHITIYHTGYSAETIKDKKKADRNIDLLKKQVEAHPENLSYWSYLADSLYIARRKEEAYDCAKKVVENQTNQTVDANRYESAQTIYLRTAIDLKKTEEEILEIVKSMGYPNVQNGNLLFFLGIYYQNEQKYDKAFSEFERYMQLAARELKMNSDLIGNVEQVCIWLTELARKLDRPQQVVHYGVLALRSNLYLDGILSAILECFSKEKAEKENANGTYGFLKKLYDYNKKKDLYFIYKCAKITNFYALQDKLLSHFTEEEQKELLYGIEKEYKDVEGILPTNVQNRLFLDWYGEIVGSDEEKMVSSLTTKLENIKTKSEELYQAYVSYYEQHKEPLNLDENVFISFEKRAHVLQEHKDHYAWLYQQLADYRSKRILTGILNNWTTLETLILTQVKESDVSGFDLDLLPKSEGEVFVDVHAGIGASIRSFVETYSRDYKKIYAFAENEEQEEQLIRNTQRFPNVETNVKGEGVLSLDDVIKEPVSWIRFHSSGEEYDALQGAREHIINEQPKLIIALDSGYENLWRIPKWIHDLHLGYKLYLRYYGGNLVPTNYVLIVVPERR